MANNTWSIQECKKLEAMIHEFAKQMRQLVSTNAVELVEIKQTLATKTNSPAIGVSKKYLGKAFFDHLSHDLIQVITEFCKSIVADGKQSQGLIRLAKKNGEMLGFLA